MQAGAARRSRPPNMALGGAVADFLKDLLSVAPRRFERLQLGGEVHPDWGCWQRPSSALAAGDFLSQNALKTGGIPCMHAAQASTRATIQCKCLETEKKDKKKHG